MTEALTITRGTNDKPVASQALIAAVRKVSGLRGQLFLGYPIIGAADGKHPIDAVLVSPDHGVVAFDLVEGKDLGDYTARQDDAATRLQQRLLGHRELVDRRTLQVPISPITFAPALGAATLGTDKDYPTANAATLVKPLAAATWSNASGELYERTLSAIQNISTIRRSRTPRVIVKKDSRGARLKRLEDQIATLDQLQSKAVIETVDGVQRIRGLAGSGKTIVLALKAAYLHAQHPDWRIAVTFNTRALKDQFQRFINSFSLEASGEEPNWANVRIVQSWGAPGGGPRDGLFYEFCAAYGATYRDFRTAAAEFGRTKAFEGACAAAIAMATTGRPLYDAILIDEAQDLSPAFLRMCYSMLDEHRRLVYAYDELQNLNGEGVPSPEIIFGADADGQPRVSFETAYDDGARRDIVLDKCYRNSRPTLVTAHGLGFGIYRPAPPGQSTGLVQMFDRPQLWNDIGYRVRKGQQLLPGEGVVLERTEASSPRFLEQHSPIDDLVQFETFATREEQNTWVAAEIERNLGIEELRPDDIVVINTDPLSTRNRLGPLRRMLLDRGIPNHLAGVDTVADVFFTPERDSVTFTGIYRAKGNEAGMVYIVNAEDAQSSSVNLARLRNRLFTAITRSKAWVRVVGVGEQMAQLQAEFERIRDAGFTLDFRYPTEAERETLQIVHRDATATEEVQVDRGKSTAQSLLESLRSGELYREDLDPELTEQLSRLLRGDA